MMNYNQDASIKAERDKEIHQAGGRVAVHLMLIRGMSRSVLVEILRDVYLRKPN